MNNTIDEFRGRYFFLSNFYTAPVTYQGIRFENNEAAFQAAKCPERMTEFCGLTPNAAKRLGRRVQLRPDWETVKYDVMYEVCMAKFTQNPDLLSKLLDTGDAELIEGNTWGDRVWEAFRQLFLDYADEVVEALAPMAEALSAPYLSADELEDLFKQVEESCVTLTGTSPKEYGMSLQKRSHKPTMHYNYIPRAPKNLPYQRRTY